MIPNRTGQIWSWTYNAKTLKQTVYYIVIHSELDLKRHHVYAYYDTDGSTPYDIKVSEQLYPWEEWAQACRIA